MVFSLLHYKLPPPYLPPVYSFLLSPLLFSPFIHYLFSQLKNSCSKVLIDLNRDYLNPVRKLPLKGGNDVCHIKPASTIEEVGSSIFGALRGNVDKNGEKCNSSSNTADLNTFSNCDIKDRRLSK